MFPCIFVSCTRVYICGYITYTHIVPWPRSHQQIQEILCNILLFVVGGVNNYNGKLYSSKTGNRITKLICYISVTVFFLLNDFSIMFSCVEDTSYAEVGWCFTAYKLLWVIYYRILIIHMCERDL